MIDIHSLHHLYCMCNIFSLSVCNVCTHAHEGMTPNQGHMSLPIVWGWCRYPWLGCPHVTGHGRGQSRSGPWLTPKCQIVYSQEGVWDMVQLYVGYYRRNSTQINTPKSHIVAQESGESSRSKHLYPLSLSAPSILLLIRSWEGVSSWVSSAVGYLLHESSYLGMVPYGTVLYWITLAVHSKRGLWKDRSFLGKEIFLRMALKLDTQ